jgi:hypothetical protein
MATVRTIARDHIVALRRPTGTLAGASAELLQIIREFLATVQRGDRPRIKLAART